MNELDERSARLAKAEKLGDDAYPSQSHRTHTCADALKLFEQLSADGTHITLAGRVRGIRRHGALTFFVLQDSTGSIQLFVKKDAVTQDVVELAKEYIDMGDFVECSGTLIVTKTAEKTLLVKTLRMLSKAVLPLPEQWHGLADVEVRFRQRYLDLLANADVMDTFQRRSQIVKIIRNFFEENAYLEVETPVLQSLAGGANARPFVTHHNALDQDLYLRIAPELYLKRLVVGGMERVFEFARCFRNEGIDHSHNPEFTMLEAYCAYADYTDLMTLIEQLFARLSQSVLGSTPLMYRGTTVDIASQFEKISFCDALNQYTGVDPRTADNATLFNAIKDQGITTKGITTRPGALDALFKKCVVSQLVNPTFVIDYPRELSPLAKRKSGAPGLVERFQLVIAGAEIVNAFSELNDPQDQLERFREQEADREKGDEEAQRIDYEYITALEHGLPPTAGLGIGIDRLVALLTDRHSLKEVILFPTLRRKEES